jgi:hypothetical protein
MYLPAANTLGFSTNGTNAVTIDSSQNVGLGVTPSAWRSTSKALQIGATGSLRGESGFTAFGDNYYTNSSNQNIYLTTAAAAFYYQSGGVHAWFNAPSGTAGNAITFTQAMTLDASGNLLVGTTSAPTGGAVSTWANAGSTRWSMGPNGGSAFVVFNTSNVGCYVVDGQTGWTGTSDGTLKNVISPITNGLSSINNLKPTIYSWKSDEENTPHAGLIAQEVQTVLPNLVNDANGTLGVNYTGLVPYLISAIQELKAEFDAYKASHP